VAQTVFETLNAQADRQLCHKKPVPRGDERSGIGNFNDRLDQVNIHSSSIRIMRLNNHSYSLSGDLKIPRMCSSSPTRRQCGRAAGPFPVNFNGSSSVFVLLLCGADIGSKNSERQLPALLGISKLKALTCPRWLSPSLRCSAPEPIIDGTVQHGLAS